MDPRRTFETQLTYPILTKEGKAPFDFSVCIIYNPEKIRKKGLKDFWDLQDESNEDINLEEWMKNYMAKQKKSWTQDFAKDRRSDSVGAYVALELYGITDNQNLPTTIIIDRRQVVREVVVGKMEAKELVSRVNKYKQDTCFSQQIILKPTPEIFHDLVVKSYKLRNYISQYSIAFKESKYINIKGLLYGCK